MSCSPKKLVALSLSLVETMAVLTELIFVLHWALLGQLSKLRVCNSTFISSIKV